MAWRALTNASTNAQTSRRSFKPVYYTVTKAGILGLTQYLAAYYAGKNIRVNALTPGGVFNGHSTRPSSRPIRRVRSWAAWPKKTK